MENQHDSKKSVLKEAMYAERLASYTLLVRGIRYEDSVKIEELDEHLNLDVIKLCYDKFPNSPESKIIRSYVDDKINLLLTNLGLSQDNIKKLQDYRKDRNKSISERYYV